MIDGGLRSLFRERLRRGIHWQSVETGLTGLGVPDSNYCGEGKEGWVEFKRTEAWAVTASSAQQISWPLTRVMRGGRVFIAVRRTHPGGPRRGSATDELWLFWGGEAARLYGEGLRGSARPLGVWHDGPARWDWAVVREILLSYQHE